MPNAKARAVPPSLPPDFSRDRVDPALVFSPTQVDHISILPNVNVGMKVYSAFRTMPPFSQHVIANVDTARTGVNLNTAAMREPISETVLIPVVRSLEDSPRLRPRPLDTPRSVSTGDSKRIPAFNLVEAVDLDGVVGGRAPDVLPHRALCVPVDSTVDHKPLSEQRKFIAKDVGVGVGHQIFGTRLAAVDHHPQIVGVQNIVPGLGKCRLGGSLLSEDLSGVLEESVGRRRNFVGRIVEQSKRSVRMRDCR